MTIRELFDLTGAARLSGRSAFEVHVSHVDVDLIRVSGALDDATSSTLATALEPLIERGGVVYIDLSGLRFLGMAGINLLVAAAQVLGERGRIELRNPPPMAQRLIDITGLDGVVDVATRSWPSKSA